MVYELRIRTADGQIQSTRLEKGSYSIGRSSANELCFPEESGLSRQHVQFEREANEWFVRDMGSKNGTMLNGERLEARQPFRLGDRVTAGRLVCELAEAETDLDRTVVFVADSFADAGDSSTLVASLEEALARKEDSPRKHVDALIKAGRELVEHRPLDELFNVILELAIEAAEANRGLVLTRDNPDAELDIRGARGEGFRISRTVCDRVLNGKQSLLVRDTSLDEALLNQQSIVENRVHSLMAVPLQTADRVIGLVYVDTSSFIRQFAQEDLELLTVLANVAAVRIENARLAEVEEQERRIQRDLQQAAEIQARLLPTQPPVVAGMDLAGYNAACRTVGGDYFDYIPLDGGQVLIIVADVAGKGLPAAMMVSSLQARVHVLAEDAPSPAAFVARLNRSVCQTCPAGRFITFFAALLDPATGELIYCNAGHNPALIIRANGDRAWLEGNGIVLGVMPKASYEQQTAQLHAGDTLVLYSDGVTEAMPAHSTDEFGEERLADIAAGHKGSAEALIHTIHRHLEEWLAGAAAQDDVTMVVAKRV